MEQNSRYLEEEKLSKLMLGDSAAIATTIGNVVSCLVVLWYLFRTKSFRLKASDFVPSLRAVGQIAKLGFSSFLTQLSIVIITIVSMNRLAKYGAQSQYGANDPQAIIGVVMKVFTIAVNLAVGISAGCQPIFGFNYGAGRYDRVKKLLGMVMRCVAVIGIVATILFQTIPAQIVGIFGTNSRNPELYSEKCVKWWLDQKRRGWFFHSCRFLLDLMSAQIYEQNADDDGGGACPV